MTRHSILLTIIALLTMTAANGQAKIYWTEAGTTPKILSADTNGTNPQTLVTTGLSYPCGIALDIQGNKMYWCDKGAGKIQSADLDGSNVQDLVTGLSQPYGIALHLANGEIYWTDLASGKIQKALLNGTNVQDILTGLNTPLGIALDTINQKLYWMEYGAQEVYQAELSGLNPQPIIQFIPNYCCEKPDGIAVNSTNQDYFFSELAGLWRMDGNLVKIAPNAPHFIALDVGANKIYYTDSTNNQVKVTGVDGFNSKDLTLTIGPTTKPQGIAVTPSPITVLQNVSASLTVDISPNPFNDFTTVDIQGLEDKWTWILYTPLGQIVQRKENISNKHLTIKKEDLTAGVYIYQIRTSDKKAVEGKLIIE